MLVGLLETKTNQRPEEALKTYWNFAPLPIRQALRWLSEQTVFTARKEPYSIALGMQAVVKRVETKPHQRDKNKTEAHRKKTQLQYLQAGSELIKWSPTSRLKIKTPYDKNDDVTLYHHDPQASLLFMQPGMFVVFSPGDAHMTELMTGKHAEEITKVIIDIQQSLFHRQIYPTRR